jgi:hypothetical protein
MRIMLTVVRWHRNEGKGRGGGGEEAHLVKLDVYEVVLASGEGSEPGVQIVAGVIDTVKEVVDSARVRV